MATEVSIRGDAFRLVLRVTGYEFGDKTSGSDANWLAGEVDVTAGSGGEFRATQRVALRTVELEQFRDQLRVLDAS